jgi:hypothetical protein
MRRAAIVFCLLAAPACLFQSPTAPAQDVDAEVVIAAGQTAAISGTSIRIYFERVIGDSRCPADVMCIQGGDAIVRIAVVSGTRDAQQYDLHTGDMKPVQHDQLTITLVQLQPYPFSSGPIQPGDYRLTLRVTGRG